MLSVMLIIMFLIIAGFFAGSEIGTYSVNRLRLTSRAQGRRPDRQALRLSKLLADRQMLVATTLIGTNASHYLASAVCTAALMRMDVRHATVWGTIILAPFVLVCAELIPKTLFARHANAIMYRVSVIVRGATFVFFPAVMLLKGVMVVFDRLFGKPEQRGIGAVSMQRLRHFLEEGRQEGVLSLQQSRMAENVMKLEKIALSQVMVPLEKVFAAPVGIGRDELIKSMRDHSYSRVPVYEGRRDNVTGVLMLLEFLCAEEGPLPQDFVRPAKKLDAATPINKALLELRLKREPMGIVIDKEGRAVGIVTIKDLVEEIVGELAAW